MSKPADKRVSVHSIRRDPPDLRRLSRVFIRLAAAQADNGVSASTSTSTNSESTAPAAKDDDERPATPGDNPVAIDDQGPPTLKSEPESPS